MRFGRFGLGGCWLVWMRSSEERRRFCGALRRTFFGCCEVFVRLDAIRERRVVLLVQQRGKEKLQ